MVCRIIAWYLLAISLASAGGSCPNEESGDPDLLVSTEGGCVRGIRAGAEGKQRAWLGIPFAKKPIGDLRFAHPEKPEPWSEAGTVVLDASSNPDACEQSTRVLFEMFRVTTGVSEDCLYLNVYAPPERVDSEELLPVLLWIHGGGFQMGSATAALWRDPHQLVERGVVFVGIQYRVNVFGFLYLGEGTGAPGNAGLMDQVMALQWVQDNIANFGGDPDKVTIMGESAGAASASYHLASPVSCSLFDKAILQSGGLYQPWGYQEQEEAKAQSEQYSRVAGCPADPEKPEDTIKCLRNLDPKKLTAAKSQMYTPYPVRDEVFMPMSPRQLFRKSLYSKKPLLLGSNANEGFMFLLPMNMFLQIYPRREVTEDEKVITFGQFQRKLAIVLRQYPQESREMVADFYSSRLNRDDPTGLFYALEQLYADGAFVCPVEDLAREVGGEAKNGVFRYHYSHRSSRSPFPSYMGTLHAMELPFVFGMPAIEGGEPEFEPEEVEFSKDIMEYWTNFVKNGNPNSPGLPEWPGFNSSSDFKVMNLKAGETFPIDNAFGDRCALWDKIHDMLSSKEDEEADASPTGEIYMECVN